MAKFVKTYLLGLCLFGFHLTRQETCSAPGNLTSPQMFLNTSSNDEGDTVWVKCLIPPLSSFSRVILCKDGKEMKSQPQVGSMFAYIFYYKISQEGAGKISCMFQFRDTDNQVKNSGLSNAKDPQQVLETEGEVPSPFPSLAFGITTSVILILAAVFYLLKERGLIKWRATRKHHGPSTALEMENQPKDQLTDPLDEGDFHDSTLHPYEEVASNQFSRTSSQEEEAQVAPHLLYSVIKVKGRTHYVPSPCEEEEAQGAPHLLYSVIMVKGKNSLCPKSM